MPSLEGLVVGINVMYTFPDCYAVIRRSCGGINVMYTFPDCYAVIRRSCGEDKC